MDAQNLTEKGQDRFSRNFTRRRNEQFEFSTYADSQRSLREIHIVAMRGVR
jgi:hypothetical protein